MSKWRDKLGETGFHGRAKMAGPGKCSCVKCKEYRRSLKARYRLKKKQSQGVSP